MKSSRGWSAGNWARPGTRFLAIAVLTFLLVSDGSAVNDADSLLDRSLNGFSAKNGEEFIVLCRTINAPCGVEYGASPTSPEGKEQGSLQLTKSTARAVLDSIAQRYPGHRWVTRDGVINLEPTSRDGEDVLARRLDTVSIHGASSFKAALDVLHQANIPTGYQIMGRPPRYALIDLELKDVTLRDALNAIAKIDGHLVWVFRLSSPNGRWILSMPSWRKSGAPFSIEERKKLKNAKPKK